MITTVNFQYVYVYGLSPCSSFLSSVISFCYFPRNPLEKAYCSFHVELICHSISLNIVEIMGIILVSAFVITYYCNCLILHVLCIHTWNSKILEVILSALKLNIFLIANDFSKTNVLTTVKWDEHYEHVQTNRLSIIKNQVPWTLRQVNNWTFLGVLFSEEKRNMTWAIKSGRKWV